MLTERDFLDGCTDPDRMAVLSKKIAKAAASYPEGDVALTLCWHLYRLLSTLDGHPQFQATMYANVVRIIDPNREEEPWLN